MDISITPAKSLQGTVHIPGSKSHTIRALLIAAAANGTSTIENALDSADTRSCMTACRALGAEIREEGTRIFVTGYQSNESDHRRIRNIDVGNSGTTLYLAAGLAAARSGTTRFTGDHQIQSRPIDKLVNSLRDLGARVEYEDNPGSAPIRITGPLAGGRTSIECPTSQYLSSLLIACPLAENHTSIEIPLLHERPYAEMTLAWLKSRAIQFENNGFKSIRIPGRQKYQAFNATIPGDYSSATFLMCAAAITGSSLLLKNLDREDVQGDKAVIDMLEKMGCSTKWQDDGIVFAGSDLHGVDLDLNETPDALPALAVTAAFASGRTGLLNVPQARLKETDRIAVMAAELGKLGVKTEELADGLVIHGQGRGISGGSIDGHYDHRVVMAFAIGALRARGSLRISTAEAAQITYPGFFETLESIRQD